MNACAACHGKDGAKSLAKCISHSEYEAPKEASSNAAEAEGSANGYLGHLLTLIGAHRLLTVVLFFR